MANKKCPKCGEDNPAEAVMCWACYTPLTAGASAVMGAGASAGGATIPRPGGAPGPIGANVEGEKEKKQIDPKIFLIVGLLAGAGVIGGFTTGAFGGGGDGGNEDPLPTAKPDDGGNKQPAVAAAAGPIFVPSPPINPNPNTGGGGGGVQSPQYSIVVPPNPTYATATFGIAAAQPSSPDQALNMARIAKTQMANNGKYTASQVAVFKDAVSAAAFKKYMISRRGRPLGSSDFANLSAQGGWAGGLIYFETRGKTERYSNLSVAPNGWWTRFTG